MLKAIPVTKTHLFLWQSALPSVRWQPSSWMITKIFHQHLTLSSLCYLPIFESFYPWEPILALRTNIYRRKLASSTSDSYIYTLFLTHIFSISWSFSSLVSLHFFLSWTAFNYVTMKKSNTKIATATYPLHDSVISSASRQCLALKSKPVYF